MSRIDVRLVVASVEDVVDEDVRGRKLYVGGSGGNW